MSVFVAMILTELVLSFWYFCPFIESNCCIHIWSFLEFTSFSTTVHFLLNIFFFLSAKACLAEGGEKMKWGKKKRKKKSKTK